HLEAKLLELRRIVPDDVGFDRGERRCRTLAAAAHLAESDETVVRLDLDDRADEAPPMTPIRVAKRRLEGDADGGGPDVDDLHAADGESMVGPGGLSPEGIAKDQLTLSLLCWPQIVRSVKHSSRSR